MVSCGVNLDCTTNMIIMHRLDPSQCPAQSPSTQPPLPINLASAGSLASAPLPSNGSLVSSVDYGYTTLPGGLVMNWGYTVFKVASSNSGQAINNNVTFAKPFLTACYQMQVFSQASLYKTQCGNNACSAA